MGKYYILKGTEVIPASVEQWAESFNDRENRIVEQNHIGEILISTVFLGLDHSWNAGDPPMIFETMIFEGKYDEYQERCSSYKQALKMHKRAYDLVYRSQQISLWKLAIPFLVWLGLTVIWG